jgi:hypothetical protein
LSSQSLPVEDIPQGQTVFLLLAFFLSELLVEEENLSEYGESVVAKGLLGLAEGLAKGLTRGLERSSSLRFCPEELRSFTLLIKSLFLFPDISVN